MILFCFSFIHNFYFFLTYDHCIICCTIMLLFPMLFLLISYCSLFLHLIFYYSLQWMNQYMHCHQLHNYFGLFRLYLCCFWLLMHLFLFEVNDFFINFSFSYRISVEKSSHKDSLMLFWLMSRLNDDGTVFCLHWLLQNHFGKPPMLIWVRILDFYLWFHFEC